MKKVIEIYKHESRVYWVKGELQRGSGFITNEGSTALVRCPSCEHENYAMNVLSGKCSWCPFDANGVVDDAE
jgi:hypothetical protein